MAHHLRFTITATATITVVRFLHLFKFGLVVYGASVAPSTGGNREIPACVFLCECSHFVQDKLLSLLKQDYYAQKKATEFQSLAIKILRCVGDSTAERQRR